MYFRRCSDKAAFRSFSVNSTVKTIIFWVVILISAVALWQVVKPANSGQKEREINFSQLMAEVEQGNVTEVTLTGMEVRGKSGDGSIFHSTAPANYPEMIKKLQDTGVSIKVRDVSTSGGSWR